MLEHLVLFKFRSDVQSSLAVAFLGELRHFATGQAGLVSLRSGKYHSSEGLNRGYNHALVMTFLDESARDAYLAHPEHIRLVERLLPLLEGGLDGLLAFDFVNEYKE